MHHYTTLWNVCAQESSRSRTQCSKEQTAINNSAIRNSGRKTFVQWCIFCYIDEGYLQWPYQTRWLYCVACPQYSIRLEARGYLCTNCLLRAFDAAIQGLVSRDSIVDCQFVTATAWVREPTSRKIWGEVSSMECTGQDNDFQLIPTVKMETRLTIDRPFGNKFPLTIIIAELWRPEVARR